MLDTDSVIFNALVIFGNICFRGSIGLDGRCDYDSNKRPSYDYGPGI